LSNVDIKIRFCRQVRVWLRDGLPPDAFSIDNAIIVSHAQHCPLFIDPQVGSLARDISGPTSVPPSVNMVPTQPLRVSSKYPEEVEDRQ
jgi:ATP-binding dynein motor region